MFPDAERAVLEIISRVHDDVVLRPPIDRDERAQDGGIVEIHSVPSPGSVEDWERTDRVEVDVYAAGLTAARDLADEVRATLQGFQDTAEGLLDDVFVVTEPYEVPYPHDVVIQVRAVYGVVSRAQ